MLMWKVYHSKKKKNDQDFDFLKGVQDFSEFYQINISTWKYFSISSLVLFAAGREKRGEGLLSLGQLIKLIWTLHTNILIFFIRLLSVISALLCFSYIGSLCDKPMKMKFYCHFNPFSFVLRTRNWSLESWHKRMKRNVVSVCNSRRLFSFVSRISWVIFCLLSKHLFLYSYHY